MRELRRGASGPSDFDDVPTHVMDDDLVQTLADRARSDEAAPSFEVEETDPRTTVAKRKRLGAESGDDASPTGKWPVLRLVAPVEPAAPAAEPPAAPTRARWRAASRWRMLLTVLAAAAVGACLGAVVPRPLAPSPSAVEPAVAGFPVLDHE